MRPLGPQRDHYWLALSMAKAAGVDLQAAIMSGHFDQKKWAKAVHQCRGCAWGHDCSDWLKANRAVGAAPESCVNAKVFAALKAAQEEANAAVAAG